MVQWKTITPITKVEWWKTMPHVAVAVRLKTMLPTILMAGQLKTTPCIAMVAWQTIMPGNTVAMQQTTTQCIIEVARGKTRMPTA